MNETQPSGGTERRWKRRNTNHDKTELLPPLKMNSIRLNKASTHKHLIFPGHVLIQLAFYVNLHRAVIGPSATLTGR